MKLQEVLKEKKPINFKRMKIIISEAQYRMLSRSIYKNVPNENEHNTIKNTQLIKTKFNAKKN